MKKLRRIMVAGTALVAIAILVGCGKTVQSFGDDPTIPKFHPQIVGQVPYFHTVEAGAEGDYAEVAATPFMTETGIIQIAVHINSGEPTAGTIVVYSRVRGYDDIYCIQPTATFLLTTDICKVSDRIFIGMGYHKLIVVDSSGTFNVDLLVRDF